MLSLKPSFVLLAMLSLAACVTINIYFPAAAAEKAADRIIEDVWGSEPPEAASPAPEARAVPIWWADALLPLVGTAHAQADLNISSPAISALQAKMRARHEQLRAFYDAGAVGLTEHGLIAVRDASLVPLAQRNQVHAWVAEENADRQALYAEIARANGHPEWQAEIQSTFARRWMSNAAKGWWVQRGGQWQPL